MIYTVGAIRPGGSVALSGVGKAEYRRHNAGSTGIERRKEYEKERTGGGCRWQKSRPGGRLPHLRARLPEDLGQIRRHRPFRPESGIGVTGQHCGRLAAGLSRPGGTADPVHYHLEGAADRLFHVHGSVFLSPAGLYPGYDGDGCLLR